jgi:hypothetical protein
MSDIPILETENGQIKPIPARCIIEFDPLTGATGWRMESGLHPVSGQVGFPCHLLVNALEMIKFKQIEMQYQMGAKTQPGPRLHQT